jgi:hypothetical protein
MLHVVEVKWLRDFRLRIEFSDGVVKEVDLAKELWGEVFEPLKDRQFFQRVALNQETGTIEWPNGADFAPEFLHEKGVDVGRAA